MPDAFRAAIMGDDVDIVAHALTVANVMALALSIAPGFENRLVGTFRQASPTGNAFVGNQQCHDPRLLLTSKTTKNIDKIAPPRP
jgi:hypothetical protein